MRKIMSYLEELLPEFKNGAKIRCTDWVDDFYIQKDGQTVIDHNNRTFHIHAEDTLSDRWELYKEPEPDWDYIIKNKCLCYFWDGNSVSDIRLGYLTKLMSDFPNKKEFSYCKDNGGAFKYCRPVCKYEVIFYEDRKDVE